MSTQSEFALKTDAKFQEADFFLQKTRDALTNWTDINETQNEARWYASACLSAARTPMNYFFDDTSPDLGARQTWYSSVASSYSHIRDLKNIRDFNIHSDPAPGIVNIRVGMSEPETETTHKLTLLHNGQNIIPILERGIAQTRVLVTRIIDEGRV
jgi:hypothetical protein